MGKSDISDQPITVTVQRIKGERGFYNSNNDDDDDDDDDDDNNNKQTFCFNT